jgi:hypothetical protein
MSLTVRSSPVIERTHGGLLDAICGRYASPGHSIADLRQIAALITAMRDRPALPIRRRGLLAVLARGLDPDPEKRWPDLPALVRALDRVRRRLIAIAIAAAVALAALAALVVAPAGRTSPGILRRARRYPGSRRPGRGHRPRSQSHYSGGGA